MSFYRYFISRIRITIDKFEKEIHTHEEELFMQTEINGKTEVMACLLSCPYRQLFFFVNYCLN